jgi:hypothetical protein
LPFKILIVFIKAAPCTVQPRKTIFLEFFKQNIINWNMAISINKIKSWNSLFADRKNIFHGHIDPFLSLSDKKSITIIRKKGIL